MADDARFLPGLSPVDGTPVQVTFDAGRLTSDGGVLVLAEIECRLGIAERLARCIEDPRAPDRVEHGLAEMIRFRALLIAAGYEDGNDCDALRADPAFKMAVGRRPERGADLCSQPTISRLENLPGPVALKRMMAAMVELFCDSFADVPRRIVLDIDDTEDRVHGRQQLSLFHAHYDSRCFLPMHIYEATRSQRFGQRPPAPGEFSRLTTASSSITYPSIGDLDHHRGYAASLIPQIAHAQQDRSQSLRY